jgi:hypothetical protein
MARFNSPLKNVRVAAPCNVDWDTMIGNDRMRFCGQCNLNVYNLSSMTRTAAENLIAGNEGRLCVRFYRRADGSILTQNCPVGLRALHRRLKSVSKAIATTVLSFLAGLGFYEGLLALSVIDSPRQHRTTMGTIAIQGDMRPVPPGRPVTPVLLEEIGKVSVNTPRMGQMVREPQREYKPRH